MFVRTAHWRRRRWWQRRRRRRRTRRMCGRVLSMSTCVRVGKTGRWGGWASFQSFATHNSFSTGEEILKILREILMTLFPASETISGGFVRLIRERLGGEFAGVCWWCLLNPYLNAVVACTRTWVIFVHETHTTSPDRRLRGTTTTTTMPMLVFWPSWCWCD